MSEERQTCPKCGKARKQEKHGSITQWITTCSCMAPEEAELQNAEAVSVCQKCGKRVNAGRSGSFTQWVFRSDLCSCEAPILVQVTTGDGRVGKVGGSFQENRDACQNGQDSLQNDRATQPANEPELAIDPKAFPVDRYKPIAVLSKGASGVVYLSRDRLLGTKIAVKCLLAISAEQLIAFQNEARANSQLTHPNIVKVLNFGATETGAPYMVMEYIAGTTLKEYIKKHGPLPLPIARKIFTQICEALSYAHGKGIFHRDLKSSNIMLVQSGSELHAYLIDFGVALVKHATQEPTIIQGNTVVGTPSYMAPDQSTGKPYDQRSEIYALGCVMFEVLSGDVPFTAETAMEVISLHASQPPPLLSEVNEQIHYPQELQDIVSKCLEKDPEKRFQSVQELSSGLMELAEKIEVARRTAERGTDSLTGTDSKKHTDKTKLLVIGSICVLLLSIGAVSLSQIWEQELKPASTKKRLTKQQKREKEFADKFTVIDAPNITTVENKIPIDDNDLRLISDFTPKGGTEFAVELRTSPELTGKNLKFLPANIVALDFYGSGITDSALKDLGSRAELRQLGLVRTQVSKDGLKHLSLPGLRNIDLSHSHNIDDDAIKIVVTNWPDLEFLAAAETGITSQSIKYIKRLTQLKTLSLNGTPVTDKDMERLSKLPALEELGITNTEVTEKGLDYLAKMPTLRALGLVGSLNLKEPAIQRFTKKRPDVTIRGRTRPEVVDFYFSPEGDVGSSPSQNSNK